MVHDPHIKIMSRALALAKRGQGYVEPNPMVGAVLVRDGQITGQGYHKRIGGDHAEIEAIKNCVDPAGCDLYVTLEPCAHHGRTPPCTEAVIKAGVKRVFAAMQDPNEKVAGRGIAALRDAGIDVYVGLCEQEVRQLYEPYIKRMTTGLPWVIAKWAQTLDGKIATSTGDSRWISGEKSRRIVHQLRARVDAIMVGVGTVIVDDPLLTARNVKVKRQALRVVMDSSGRTPADARLLQGSPQTIVTKDSLRDVLLHLAKAHDATNVLVEGGSTLLGSLFADGLVDQLIVFAAPKVLGDYEALPAVRGLQIKEISDAKPLCLRAAKRVGDDVMLDYGVM
jgi:diaminohydroxyphosphoribosylaminopyrimidine deaminase/5-amino-6-(5-phosphoribosylamino)uracil reductase